MDHSVLGFESFPPLTPRSGGFGENTALFGRLRGMNDEK